LERALFTLGEHGLVSLPGRVEVIGGYADGMAVEVADPQAADALPADLSISTRLRMAPSLTFEGRAWPVFTIYQLSADLDIRYEAGRASLDEALVYDPVQTGRNRLPTPRLLAARGAAIGEHISLSFGLTRSSWGLGMLANDGAPRGPIDGASPFGFARTADRVVRAQIAAFPFGRPDERGPDGEALEPPLTVAVAADAVVEDDTANWVHGDRTWHAVGAVRGRVEGFRGGLYAVHRRQTHGEGGYTHVTVVDLHARQDLTARNVRIWAEIEAALTVGETTYAQHPLHPGPQDVMAGGMLLRMGTRGSGFGAVLEAGYASGDDNPFDTEQRAFSFDREYRVGLLMFRESLRKSTAVTAANIADPTYRATPPRGFERAATAGAVRGAVYVNPRLTYEITDGLTAMAGYLHATSDGTYTDPFQSGLVGGASAGPRGALLATHFGDEIDLGL
ncbi:MAG: hypothetical protein QF464_19430, partial [Myxococcota bacterium]|nr:hypothetical protein [Myxococcota bacterium]